MRFPESGCSHNRSSHSGKNHPQRLHPTTEHRSVSTPLPEFSSARPPYVGTQTALLRCRSSAKNLTYLHCVFSGKRKLRVSPERGCVSLSSHAVTSWLKISGRFTYNGVCLTSSRVASTHSAPEHMRPVRVFGSIIHTVPTPIFR
jgi:hypothetical protein